MDVPSSLCSLPAPSLLVGSCISPGVGGSDIKGGCRSEFGVGNSSLVVMN